ncbi:MAG TPA: class I SAM-dependent rRNA methyltransferase [Polyangia bacterium]|jgi:23S rRNA (cytosine1962-C5)-methyltransferase|nr:class I SAM-dependent rRNA methyltransferase [Polyangia bacterium]
MRRPARHARPERHHEPEGPRAALPSVGEGGQDSRARVFLRQGRARPLWFGHPWVYANAIEKVEGDCGPGDVVSLCDQDGRLIGRGFYNPRSQIAVRLCTRKDEPVNAAFFRARLQRARALRTRLGLPSPATDIYRLVNSEGDDLPGLVIDVFDDAAVVQITTLGLSQRRAEIFDAVEAEIAPKTVYEVSPAGYADLEGFVAQSRVARGDSRPTVTGREDGIRLEIEPLSGQKTGMFIDQRETRIRVGQLARGARVLDCYAYAGGFGLQAARGGAASVTAVDSSARAVTRIEAHATKNGVSINTVEADAFRYLETATPRSFDLIVIDPPKFARARKDLEAARKGYERLNALALSAAAPGAVLVTCSCSQNVDAETFERIVAAGAKQAGRQLQIIERRGPAADHPMPPGFNEGQYLKVLLAYVY